MFSGQPCIQRTRDVSLCELEIRVHIVFITQSAIWKEINVKLLIYYIYVPRKFKVTSFGSRCTPQTLVNIQYVPQSLCGKPKFSGTQNQGDNLSLTQDRRLPSKAHPTRPSEAERRGASRAHGLGPPELTGPTGPPRACLFILRVPVLPHQWFCLKPTSKTK